MCLCRPQVAVSSSDIDFKWSISPEVPVALRDAAAATAAGALTVSAEHDAASHYGIMLAKLAGLPSSITGVALEIAQQLNSQHRQRQLQQGSSSSSMHQVYSLVHKLGCVAREAAAGGLLEVDASGQPTQADAVLSASGVDAGATHADMTMCRQLLQKLKVQAEELLLSAASRPMT